MPLQAEEEAVVVAVEAVVAEDIKGGTGIAFLQMWKFSQSLKNLKINSRVYIYLIFYALFPT